MKSKKQISWHEKQETLANESGLAVIIVEGKDSSVVSESNNNSICKNLQSSEKFAPLCQSFCGEVTNHVREAKKSIGFRCHAGLNYMAVPIENSENRQMTAIVGRTFLKTEEYVEASKRAESGDWQEFDVAKLFDNALFSSSAKDVEILAKTLENLSDDEKTELLFIDQNESPETEELNRLIERFQNDKNAEEEEKINEKQNERLEEIAAWRSLFGSLPDLNYKQACVSILQFLAKHYKFSSLAWLKQKRNVLEITLASGKFKGSQMQFSIAADDSRLLDVFNQETSLELRQRKTNETSTAQTVQLFPLVVGNDVRGALVIGDEIDESLKNRIAGFCRNLSSQIEILQLREELEKQALTSKILQRFNDNLTKIDSEDFWHFVVQTTAELLQAERGSILVFDEENKEFSVKSAVGNNADILKGTENIGERIAQKVLADKKPLLVKDIQEIGLPPAPPDYKYKSNSFICYPILIGGRKVGVLNFTDKADGGTYDEADLQILDTIAPQIAVAIERASFKRQAGEYEQLSMTDLLTGLPNRRYLQERLSEEIKRFQRNGNPTGFMMIDVDNFKTYNDTFGHPEGDKALQLVAQCFRETLRGADVAARFGGEEFSILLPQTTFDEALIIADRIRQKVETTVFPHRQITVSIGVAYCSSNLSNAAKLISAADSALYQAKAKGKNNVQKYTELKTVTV